MARIMLVEDNEMNRDMLTRRLTKRGFDVTTTEDGRDAIDKAALDKPDLILMDIMLPVMDGLEATRHLKASPDTTEIPIIVLTANASTKDRELAFEAGGDEFETKPVNFSKLMKKIDGLI